MASTVAETLVFNTGEPAYAVDREGTIVSWNSAAEREFGFPEHQALGQPCWKLLRGEDLFGNRYCCEHCPHREMASLGQPIKPSRIRFRTATGQHREFLLSTLVFSSRPGHELLIHLCRSQSEPDSRAQPVRSTAAGNGDVLTAREQQVLACLARGLSTRQVAGHLRISVATVRNHVEHILTKLDAHSRLEAVATARRWGLL